MLNRVDNMNDWDIRFTLQFVKPVMGSVAGNDDSICSASLQECEGSQHEG
jgi:hypothetical protein